MKIRTRFIVSNVVVVGLALVCVTATCLVQFSSELRRQAIISQESRIKTFWELLGQKGERFAVADGKLKVGDYVINDNFELPDRLKELTGGTATIFMGDTRVSTNVMKPDGSRAVGSKLQGPAYDTVLKEGKPFRGEVKILDVPYFAAYDPIKDAQGQVIGALYVGIKKSEYFSKYDHLRWGVTGMVLLVLLIAGVVTGFVVNRLFAPLGRMHDVLRDIAEGEGDLTRRLEYLKDDEIGEMSRSFNTFMDKLHGIITKAAVTVERLAAASTQMRGSAEQIVVSAEHAAEQAGNAATASEEMTTTSSEIARNCVMAADVARQATESASTGAAVVDTTVAMMDRIASRVKTSALAVESLGSRSDQIGEIVGTIEEIADQTNLLALNAAIEAARAGEQGRGFAVVADEVRALAERTTKATKEIAQMIKAIQEETKDAVAAMQEGVSNVETGTSEAARSGRALQEILEQINSVTVQVNQIATAAEEQTATTGEISGAIQGITSVVQISANEAQQSATVANQLKTLAEELTGVVGQFKLAS